MFETWAAMKLRHFNERIASAGAALAECDGNVAAAMRLLDMGGNRLDVILKWHGIDPKQLAEESKKQPRAPQEEQGPAPIAPARETLAQARARHQTELRAIIADAVEQAGGSRALAAEALGVTPGAVRKQLRYYAIDVPSPRRLTRQEWRTVKARKQAATLV